MLAHNEVFNEVFSGTALGHCDLWLSMGVLAFIGKSLGRILSSGCHVPLISSHGSLGYKSSHIWYQIQGVCKGSGHGMGR